MSGIKQKLYDECAAYVNKLLEGARQAYESAEQASHDDTKSSAGDKYETGRAMMQQEKDRNALQLAQAGKLKAALQKINPNGSAPAAKPGSLIITDNGNFYLAVSAGSFIVDDKKYFAVSPVSPIGLQLRNKKAGDKFSLNGKVYQISDVC